MTTEPDLDVVGIGGLLIDYILEKDIARQIDPTAIFGAGFELGQTARTSNGDYISNAIKGHPAKRFYAGSAFNAVHAISASKVGLKLGFIGVTGTAERDIDFKEYISTLGIDNKYVFVSSIEKTGQCLSYLHHERTLLVYGGANLYLGEYLQNNQSSIIEYITRAKWLHFSSFFDEKFNTPSILYNILVEARRRNPFLRISFDPGHIYAQRQTPDIRNLLSITDYLFLNETEFRYLGDVVPYGNNEAEAGERVFQLTGPTIDVVLTKKYDSIHALHKYQGKLWIREYRNQRVPGIFVKDDTGAGDVFAAGFIMTQLVPILGNDIAPAVRLANRLVREKLRDFGPTRYDNFAGVVESFIRERYEKKWLSPKDWFFENWPQVLKYVGGLLIAFLLGLLTNYLSGLLFR